MQSGDGIIKHMTIEKGGEDSRRVQNSGAVLTSRELAGLLT